MHHPKTIFFRAGFIFVVFSQSLHLIAFPLTSEENNPLDKRYTTPAEVALPGIFPWIIRYSSILSGVMLTPKILITSAHSLVKSYGTYCIVIRLLNANPPFEAQVDHFSIHPDYNDSGLNDIAVVNLSEPIDTQQHNITFPLIDTYYYSCNEKPDNRTLFGAGYADSDILKFAELVWLNPEIHSAYGCEQNNLPSKYVAHYAGHSEQGNSGSPLFYKDDENFYLLGILFGSYQVNNATVYFEPIARHLNFLSHFISFNHSEANSIQPIPIEIGEFTCPIFTPYEWIAITSGMFAIVTLVVSGVVLMSIWVPRPDACVKTP